MVAANNRRMLTQVSAVVIKIYDQIKHSERVYLIVYGLQQQKASVGGKGKNLEARTEQTPWRSAA